MTIKDAQKELSQNCEKFLAVLEKKPKLNGHLEIVDVHSLNQKMLKSLQEIFQQGSEADKKEAIATFFRVIKTFGDMTSKAVSLLSSVLGPEGIKTLSQCKLPKLQFKEIFTEEQLKMFNELDQKEQKPAKKDSKKK